MTSEPNQANKQSVWKLWRALEDADAGDLERAMTEAVDPGFQFHGPDPINDLAGADAFDRLLRNDGVVDGLDGRPGGAGGEREQGEQGG